MKLKHRCCPKGCRAITGNRGKQPNQRMNIIVKRHRVSQTRYDILLDWWCPSCDYTEPVNSKDIRRISKKTKYPIGSTRARESYELE